MRNPSSRLFRRAYSIPSFEHARFAPGQVVRAAIGLDGGSTSSKAVLLDEEGNLLTKQYQLSKGNPIADTKELLAKIKAFVHDQGATLEVLGFGGTGYAADVLEESLRADVNIVETVAHMMAAVKYCGDVDVICDIGGQDIKVLFMVNKRDPQLPALEPVLGRQRHAAAGDGQPVRPAGDRVCGCRVQGAAQPEVQLWLRGVPRRRPRELPERGLLARTSCWRASRWCCRRTSGSTWCRSRAWPSSARRYVLQGGTQYNLAAVKAQVDYIKARVPDADGQRPPASGRSRRDRRGARNAPRRQAARPLDLHRPRRGDRPRRSRASTTRPRRCHFCPNNCSRTFIDTKTPDGRTSRYISGFSCEKGTVESLEALRALETKRKGFKTKFPEPRRLRGAAGLPSLLHAAADSRRTAR